MTHQLFSKTPCLYCGANQTSHFMTRFDTGLSIGSTRRTERMMRTKIGQLLYQFVSWLLVLTIKVWKFFGVVTYSTDAEKIKLGRARVLFEEAQARGIPIVHVMFLGKSTDIFRAYVAGKWMQFQGLPRRSDYENPSLVWMDDKARLKKELMRAGIPVPKGGSVKTLYEALDIFRSVEKPVIVKPRLGSRGRHTTTHIYTEDELTTAFYIAKEMCPHVIVEEHIAGPVWRGTVIDGKLVGVLGGEPPKITGDGEHTIIELIRIKNETKDTRIKDVVINHLVEDFLHRQGYTYDSVLPTGVTIDLSEKIGISYGGKSIEVTTITHPLLKTYLEAAAKVVNDPLLGFDFIVPDVTKNPDEQKFGIIECNAVPFINLHHHPLVGEPQNVAGALWEYIIRHEEGIRKQMTDAHQ